MNNKEKPYKLRKVGNKIEGKRVEIDPKVPNRLSYGTMEHYHYLNPNSTSDKDAYLDKFGNPCPDGSYASSLYPPKRIQKNASKENSL